MNFILKFIIYTAVAYALASGLDITLTWPIITFVVALSITEGVLDAVFPTGSAT